jgi:hypothetical protein
MQGVGNVMGNRDDRVHIIGQGLLAVAVMALLGGCRMNEAVYQGATRIGQPRSTLAGVLDELDDRHLQAETVGARLNLTLHDARKQTDVALLGVYAGDKSGNMRLRITATTNNLVLDMGRHGDTIEVHLPRQGRYFRGPAADLCEHRSDLALLANIGAATDLFYPRPWTPEATERTWLLDRGRETICVSSVASSAREAVEPLPVRSGLSSARQGRLLRRMAVAPEAAEITEVEVYHRSGARIGTVSYGDYCFPLREIEPILLYCRPGAAAPVSPPYPRRILLCPDSGNYTLQLATEELFYNTPIQASRFEVPVPDGVKVAELGAALKRTTNLWE